jgi:hypothetical protein
MSIYTPVMPAIGRDLLSGADSVKLTLTTYMLGFAMASSSTGRSATDTAAGRCSS